MKTTGKLILTLLFLVSFFSCLSTKTIPEKINEVTQQVLDKDYTIRVNYANPLRGRQIYLSGNYDLKVKNDSAFAYLPYYGVAQVAPFDSSEGGIKFAEPMSDYVIVPNKKNNGWDIKFNVKAKYYTYNVSLNIFNNGNTTLSVNSYERDIISFSGEME